MPEQKITKREMRRIKHEEKQKRREEEEKSRKKRRMLTRGIGIAVIALIVFGLSQIWSDGSSRIDNNVNPMLVTSKDNIKGNPDAYVTLVEYSDFQCPACRSYYPMLKKLNEKYPDNLRIVYRHFPLVQIHQHATRAAQAAEAAGMQGKFWEMHDMIFNTQDSWSESDNPKQFFADLAGTLGLDVEKFERDIESDEVMEKVKRDTNSGIKLGVSATPTFYLNGRKLANPRSFDEFSSLIRDAIDNTPTINPLTGEVTKPEDGNMTEVGSVQLESATGTSSATAQNAQESQDDTKDAGADLVQPNE